MALFSKRAVLDRADIEIRNLYYSKTPSSILNESSNTFNKYKTYDIFLSHSYQDAKIVLGVKKILEDMRYSVYVDWIEDKQLDRSKVNKETARILKERMKSSNCLFYLTTENATNSKWMPWELGYFDGVKNKVAVLPVEDITTQSDIYIGQEYLGIYSYITQSYGQLFVNTSHTTRQRLNEWLEE
ncbi:TIR domain-containing protein [Candidatus Clostridium radicumherbarum]|uniref:TIR domain-containing protein n=1 Tax=Candidatus Clostridium radicumherbarum TaxID=3381662 RepID=A0ABW8U020_9CLOT